MIELDRIFDIDVDEETEESRSHTKVPRSEQVAALVERDGVMCQFPDCDLELNFELTGDNDMSTTIDHWMPQWYGKSEGWTYDQIWDLSNLKLMHKKCNARKGERIPNDDGTLPKRKTRTFRYKRDKRAGRPEECSDCQNGHALEHNEVCGSCGTFGKFFNRDAKVKYSDCDHEILWCWICSITPDMRPSSIGIAMRQADTDELGEMHDLDEVIEERNGYSVVYTKGK